MGIPSYFSYIIKNHKKIIKLFQKNKMKVHNLYLDSNSIIYDCFHKMDLSKYSINDKELFENELCYAVCEKISHYIENVDPSNIVFIAFDGVVPFAKMNQQRQRRFKSYYTKHYIKDSVSDLSSQELSENSKFTWDQTAITPGTAFMKKLGTIVSKYFIDNEMHFNAKRILVSTTKDVGEGEHKIFKFIKDNKPYHSSTKTFIYGLDADLIMLCLNHLHISSDIFLFREAPNFGFEEEEYNEYDLLFLNIYYLGKVISYQLRQKNSVSIEDTFMDIDKVHDYIFISFLLGNDFMPHFPALNIRTNGIQIMMQTYKALFKNHQTITNKKTIHYGRLKKYIKTLAKNEMKYICREYNMRNKRTVRVDKTDIEKYLHFIPQIEKDEEHYLCPHKEGFKYRYYKRLFSESQENKNFINDLCRNYLHGLLWNHQYYYEGCHDYNYTYKYCYPPLLEDLADFIPNFDIELLKEDYNVVNEKTLLSYVCPPKCLESLLDEESLEKIKNVKNITSEKIDFKWVFCKYFWESHAVLPNVDIHEIQQILG